YSANAAGSQPQLFRGSVGARRSGEELPEGGYQGAYIEELAHEDGDPVPRMLEQIDATLERFRIHFDPGRRQSELEGRLPELIERLETYETGGAVWVRSSQFGDDKDRVIVRSQ